MFGGPLSFFQKWRKRREKQSILSKKTRTQGKCGVGKKGPPLARFPSALWKVHFGASSPGELGGLLENHWPLLFFPLSLTKFF